MVKYVGIIWLLLSLSPLLHAEDKGISVDELRELAKEADQEADQKTDKTLPQLKSPATQKTPSTGNVLGPAVEKILDAPITHSGKPSGDKKPTDTGHTSSEGSVPAPGKTIVAPANSGPQPPSESTTAVDTKTKVPKKVAVPKPVTPAKVQTQAPLGSEKTGDRPPTSVTKSSTPSTAEPLSKPKSEPAAPKPPSVSAASKPKPTAAEDEEEDEIYIAPKRITSAGPNNDEGADTPISKNFGIPSGTWLRVELIDEISSAGTNRATLKLLHTVSGDFDVLPKGTLLYAYSKVIPQSHRIDLTVTEGITPSGLHFSGRATAYDKKRRVGLAGTVVKMNMPASIENSTQAVLDLERAAKARNSQGVTQSDVSTPLTQPNDDLIILVPPQKALLRVDTAF